MDVDSSQLHLNNRTCRGDVDADNMVTFGFDENNSCGTEVTVGHGLRPGGI